MSSVLSRRDSYVLAEYGRHALGSCCTVVRVILVLMAVVIPVSGGATERVFRCVYPGATGYGGGYGDHAQGISTKECSSDGDCRVYIPWEPGIHAETTCRRCDSYTPPGIFTGEAHCDAPHCSELVKERCDGYCQSIDTVCDGGGRRGKPCQSSDDCYPNPLAAYDPFTNTCQVFANFACSGVGPLPTRRAPTATLSPRPTRPPPTRTPTAVPACAGDCTGTHTVAVNDIITLVNIALGTVQPSACLRGVGSGPVTIVVIIQAVNNALDGCQ